MSETIFERRKEDHIRLALDPRVEASGKSGLNSIELIHEALPDLNFNEINLETTLLGKRLPLPLFVSSMTAGHTKGEMLNSILASTCQNRGWAMGVGSQRRELNDSSAREEWKRVRARAPEAMLMGNIGISQLVMTKVDDIARLVDSLEAFAMIVHTNSLQEVLQPEGTPNFKGAWDALERLAKNLSVPVVLKETGCGFSKSTLERLKGIGLGAVDVSGFGGTHWGRLEGQRSPHGDLRHAAAQTFRDWGIPTVESLCYGKEIKPDYELWASGGVRSGLDAGKLLALGASAVGYAKPILEAALEGEDVLARRMELVEFELKVALFCTGSKNLADLRDRNNWRFVHGPSA